MERFLREWRQESLNKHQYESAIFIGDKLLALSSEYGVERWIYIGSLGGRILLLRDRFAQTQQQP